MILQKTMQDAFCKDNEKIYRCKKPPSTPKNDCEHKMTIKIYIYKKNRS